MKKILGLDLGTNSIGWALIAEENGQLKNIDEIGSRIIPEKDEHRDFEKGNDISKNAVRRQKRGMRRLNERYKMRRNSLIKLFNILEIVPSGLEHLFEKITFKKDKLITPRSSYVKGDKQFKPHELYELRAKAQSERVTLNDLFRIIYHLNQRRGFKSNKKANKQDEENIVDEAKKKSDVTIEKVKIMQVEQTGEKRRGKDEYSVILEDGRNSLTEKYIFKKFEGQTIVLEIKKEITKSLPDPKFTFSLPTKWQRNRKELNEAIIISGSFPGKYFFEEFLKAKEGGKPFEFRVRENIVNRELYEKEFLAIWTKQSEEWEKNGVDINHLPKFKEALELIIPRHNKEEKQLWAQKGLGEFIKNYIIYYQRGLKSQTKTIGDCLFEEKYYKKLDEKTGEIILERNGPKCCPKSHPIFQEFRMWQQINNLIAYDDQEEEVEINNSVKAELFDYLNERDTANVNDKKNEILNFIKKRLPNVETVNVVRTWVGNKTAQFFKKKFKSNRYDGSILLNDKNKYLQLWHLIYSVGDEKGIRNGLKKMDSEIPENLIKALCEADFEEKEKQYASLSLKAINNLLPLMHCGTFFSVESINDKNKKRIEQFLENQLDEEFDIRTLLKLKKKNNIKDFNGLSYYQAASLIYGKHTAKQEEKYKKPEDVLPVPRHSLRNPIVEQIVNETLMLVKDLWLKYPGLSDGEIRIELARAFKVNKEQRQNISKRQEENKYINAKAVEEIQRHKGTDYNPTLAEIEKVKLWNEANKQSPYTGKCLKISEILSAYTDVDHIIPKARFYNDGLVNKTVCESHINADKGKMTAFEYMTIGTECQNDKLNYDEFLQLIKCFPFWKRRIFTMKEIPDDFINRQLKDTQYISKRIKEELGKVVGNQNVKTTTGSVTDYLKDQWGFAELMKTLIKPRFVNLQEKYNMQLIKVEDILDREDKLTGKKRTIIKGFSKRFDHRHHAVDALIVACTRQGIIQQLNLLNQITSGKTKQIEETVGDSLRKFIPPTGKQDISAIKFYSMAENAVKNIIVSYKNRKRLVSKGVNWYQRFNTEKNVIVKVKQNEENGKQRNWAIKGELHKQTNYGIINFNGTKRYTSRCGLAALTENKISNIPSKTIKKEIENHINREEYNGDLKKAFSPEGILDFNKDRKMPLYSVIVMEDGEMGKAEGKTFLYGSERKLAVEKGGNFSVAVYEHPESKEREFDVVSFFDAVHLKTSGENPYQTEKGLEFQKAGYKMLFTLTHYDLVYIPKTNDDIFTINWAEKMRYSDRIYRAVKFSGITIYFQPHNIAHEITVHKGIARKASQYKGEFGYNTNGTQYLIGTKELIRNTCIKLQVDRLGNIKPAT